MCGIKENSNNKFPLVDASFFRRSCIVPDGPRVLSVRAHPSSIPCPQIAAYPPIKLRNTPEGVCAYARA